MESKKSPSIEYLVLDGAVCVGLFSRVPLRDLLLEPGEVAVATAGIGNDVVRVLGMLRDDGVVNNATAFVEEDRECRGVGRERLERRGGEPFEEGGRRRAAETGRPG